MSYFEEAFNNTIGHEGQYINDPDDPGGETHWGISKRSYPDLDIKDLSKETARQIYKRDYWEYKGLSIIKTKEIAIKLFDIYVNINPRSATLILQRALMAAGMRVKWDGILGPATLNATNKADQDKLIAALRSEHAAYYDKLILMHPEKEKWKNGWLRRAYS